MQSQVQMQEVGESSGKRHSQRQSYDEKTFNNIRKILKEGLQDSTNPYEKIPQIPNLKLSYEDMNSDPINLLMRLQEQYRDFGAVKLSACESWRCPFMFRYVDKGITTRIQNIRKLKEGKGFQQNIEAYNIKSYETFAQSFQKKYAFKSEVSGTSPESKKQLQYWKLVTDEKYCKTQVKVQYAADLPSLKYGSGFPTRPLVYEQNVDFIYENCLFNLNNILKSPNSILAISEERKEKVSGITHPWVYMGMLFSTFCWHVEDLWVNSLNYSHKGAIKTWYIIPGDYKQKFDEYVTNKYCITHQKKNLLDRITFMIDPLELIENGIPVYKAYQHPKDFICTFFKAYHCGFSQGYNVGEAVNFMSPLSIQLMIKAKEAKLKHNKKSAAVIPIQWLIHQNYGKREKFEKYSKMIEQYYKKMVQQEKDEIMKIKQKYDIREVQIFSKTCRYDKFYCCICKDYLYLHVYKSTQNNKNYCFLHLLEQAELKQIIVLLRELNEDRQELKTILEK